MRRSSHLAASLSTEDLLEQVWDEHTNPFTNTVTVTIGRLRRKLGDPPIVTTIPGVGYRITDPAEQWTGNRPDDSPRDTEAGEAGM